MITNTAPVRHGRHVTIRPLRPADYDRLYEIALFSDAGSRWRLHGDVPPFDRFLQILLADSRATFAIETNEHRQVVGMVQLWSYEPLNRQGHITAFLDPALRGRGWPLEGILLFIDYVFPAFNLRKLYFESLESELAQYGSLVGTLLKQEGCLREHRWAFGRFEDAHILALYADDAQRLLQQLMKGDAQPVGQRQAPSLEEADEELVAPVRVGLPATNSSPHQDGQGNGA